MGRVSAVFLLCTMEFVTCTYTIIDEIMTESHVFWRSSGHNSNLGNAIGQRYQRHEDLFCDTTKHAVGILKVVFVLRNINRKEDDIFVYNYLINSCTWDTSR